MSSSPIKLPITGGCYCGNIRYESSEAFSTFEPEATNDTKNDTNPQTDRKKNRSSSFASLASSRFPNLTLTDSQEVCGEFSGRLDPEATLEKFLQRNEKTAEKRVNRDWLRKFFEMEWDWQQKQTGKPAASSTVASAVVTNDEAEDMRIARLPKVWAKINDKDDSSELGRL